MCSRIFLTDIK